MVIKVMEQLRLFLLVLSVPRLFWSIFPPMGKDDKCAITHDYFYALGLFNRKICDLIFFRSNETRGRYKMEASYQVLDGEAIWAFGL